MKHPIDNKMNTVFVHVSDLKTSAQWYAKLLGQEINTQEVQLPVWNMKIQGHTGLTLDAGKDSKKVVTPSPYPLFNFHTDNLEKALQFVMEEMKVEEIVEKTEISDFSYFLIKDPDGHCIMICTG
ncbi:VOC family protein [Jeotgalibacillus sp. ET6]|uniref:VOC family protein n=1 Tax=Jeotgalibacillus sp. ET6 TaxID=3037260 RepID=UPI0024186B5F|nr:VOC family protein [Jeotgalibacillus sp. ET6]MDG5472237.1 VOC family protein [Jeotgalibacillus sp. ET6]